MLLVCVAPFLACPAREGPRVSATGGAGDWRSNGRCLVVNVVAHKYVQKIAIAREILVRKDRQVPITLEGSWVPVFAVFP